MPGIFATPLMLGATPQVLNSLYRDLVAPVADLMASRSKIIVVADGPLQTVPLEFLVRQYGPAEEKAFRATRQTADGSADRPFLAEYSALDYLGKSFRFAYLPSLSTLTSQRLYPKAQSAHRREFVAFADPIFTPGPGKPISPQTMATLDALGGTVPRSRTRSITVAWAFAWRMSRVESALGSQPNCITL